MINEKKIPDEIQPAKPNWRRRLLIANQHDSDSCLFIFCFPGLCAAAQPDG